MMGIALLNPSYAGLARGMEIDMVAKRRRGIEIWKDWHRRTADSQRGHSVGAFTSVQFSNAPGFIEPLTFI